MNLWSRLRCSARKNSAYGVTERGFRNKNCFEDIARILRGRVKPIIFDVGAYDGDTTKIFLNYFPDGSMYIFEPSPDRYTELKNKYQGENNVNIFDYAIANHEGRCDYYLFSDGATNSLLPMTANANSYTDLPVEQERQVSVRCTTLDKFCLDNGIDRIDILKLDVQGGELIALNGAKRLLRDKLVELLLTEITFVRVYKNQAEHYEVAKMLDDFGYSVYDFYNFAYDNKSGRLKWGDAIFLH